MVSWKCLIFPAAAQTQPFGITEAGQVVGDIFDENNNVFGFYRRYGV